MPNELKTLSREDVYALVWAEPMTKVAARFEEAFGWMKTVAGNFLGILTFRNSLIRRKRPFLARRSIFDV